MIRIESEGSFWFINERESYYIRVPKREGPRKPGTWEEPEPGNPLRDLEQHYMEDWRIIPTREDTKNSDQPEWACRQARQYHRDFFPILVIAIGSGIVVSAPGAREPSTGM